MAINYFNQSNSKDTFAYYSKNNNKTIYYKIDKSVLLRLIGEDDELTCSEIESDERFRNFDEKILLQHSLKYMEYDNKAKWKYYLEDFCIECVVFNGFKSFPPHIYKTGKGFVNGFTPILEKGIMTFLGEGRLGGLVIDSEKKTSISQKPKGIYHIILNIEDFKNIFSEVLVAKKTGSYLAQETLATFLNERFPNCTEYNDIERKKVLKKMLLAALDESVISILNQHEIEKVNVFYQFLLKNTNTNQKIIHQNYLQITECKLDSILEVFQKNLLGNPREQTWQNFFQENIFIFDSRYIDFIPKHCIKTGRSSEPDFLVYDIYGYVDIYEIKRSSVPLLQYDSSHDNYYWSTEVSKAISQLEKYLFYCSENRLSIENSLKLEKNIDVKIIKPKGVLVIGKRDALENEKMLTDFEILRASLKNIEIILYDEMYYRLSNLKKSALHEEQE